MECPAKLYYTGKEEYANQNIDDPFMSALAEGGFQVGALAQAYYPEGIDLVYRSPGYQKNSRAPEKRKRHHL